MNAAELDALMRGISPSIKALTARIAVLEARAQKTIAYRGAHSVTETYDRGDCVTCAGTLWFATESTNATPGSGSGWKMMAKTAR